MTGAVLSLDDNRSLVRKHVGCWMMGEGDEYLDEDRIESRLI